MSLRRRSEATRPPGPSMDRDKLQATMSRQQPRPWLLLLGLLVLVTFAYLLHDRWRPTEATVKLLTPQASDTRDSPFQLHPGEHAQRPAKTLTYHWDITSEERRPDGVLKRVYLINNAFPGPTIETRPGDRLIIEVVNSLQETNESISLHWHGLSMHGYNEMDGAAGITQDTIQPGQTFTYDFKIPDDQTGTFWYHAHSAVQRADGLYGGLIVHKPGDINVDEHLLMIGDWYHRQAEDVLEWYLNADSFGMEPVPDSILINGRGRYNCDNAVAARPVDCRVAGDVELAFDSQSTRLRIVNVGGYSGFTFSVPGAELEALTVDGGNHVSSPVVDSVTILHPGERTDILVSAWNSAKARLHIDLPSSKFKYSNPALNPSQSFAITLAGSSQKKKVQSAAVNLDTARPAWTPRVPVAHTTLLLYTMTEKLAHLDYVPHGNINRTIWRPQSPPLIMTARSDWDGYQFVPHIPYDAEKPLWVDLVINNLDEEDHPFHLHGHDFYVMSSHTSPTNWGSYNPFLSIEPPGGPYTETPVKKDTFAIPRRGYAVLRFEANNPGIWMLHCHVIWHLASGMAMALEVS